MYCKKISHILDYFLRADSQKLGQRIDWVSNQNEEDGLNNGDDKIFQTYMKDSENATTPMHPPPTLKFKSGIQDSVAKVEHQEHCHH